MTRKILPLTLLVLQLIRFFLKKTRNVGIPFCTNTPVGCPFSLADNLVGNHVVDGGFPSSLTHLPLSFPSTLTAM